MNRSEINSLLNITEGYQMPDRLMQLMLQDTDRAKLFDSFMQIETDLGFDWFTEYYQEEHGDRKQLKQDFTPDCLCKIISRISPAYQSNADICSGTGGMTIKSWKENKQAYYYCEEFSQRAIPALLFNLAIRNISGQVVHTDALTGDVFAIYDLLPKDKYSDIRIAQMKYSGKFDRVIMNPPYSLSWEGKDRFSKDERFIEYGIAPKSKADFAFVLHGLYKLADKGTLIAILPHGVLFRSNEEAAIREQLIKKNILDAVIGIPDKLFMNTDIPVCLLLLKNGKINQDTFFCDASEGYVKDKAHNLMNDEHVNRLLEAYDGRKLLERYSRKVTLTEIEKNNYNLNIPRYIDRSVPEEIPDIGETIEELHKIDKEIHAAELSMFELMNQLVGTTPEAELELQIGIEKYANYIKEKYGSTNHEGLEVRSKKTIF